VLDCQLNASVACESSSIDHLSSATQNWVHWLTRALCRV